ncbi:MAG: TIGR03751 family conjugal transfer lipoprotein [Burkholderiales bacterium]|nr:TIGR03751 family conjugal transfer lipoprotein [Burkholderiales bacterium]
MARAMLASATLSAGCTSLAPRESPLPHDGATMTDVYRHHMNGEGGEVGAGVRDRLSLRGADNDAALEQRRAVSEPLNNRFERLPNPDLTLHVFPHLAQGHYPVPGYDTVFPMYESVQYAMPGEVAPRRRVERPMPSTASAPTVSPSPASAPGERN